MYVSEKIEVRETKKGKSLFVVGQIGKNETIFEFERNFIEDPTGTSMQIDNGVHQEATDSDALENSLNHSCKPNGYIEFRDLTYRALHPIARGEELTFNYNTTEWDMVKGFQCQCGHNGCYGHIMGFKYLTCKQQKEIEPWLSSFLKEKLNNTQCRHIK
ncbi:MAG: SET domain-containing protein [bacterium]|nr:SET domain-containing protein [bacterium]